MQDVPSQLNNLRARLDEADAPGARLQAHALKGAAATVAAEGLRAIALAMERAGAAGQLDRCGELLPRAVEEFERFKSTLERAGWVSRLQEGRQAMINLDDELAEDYLAECREHLAAIETDLLAIEKGGAEIDEELVNRVFRAVHSVKGGAGFFDLAKIRELAHQTENVLALIRSRKMVPTPERVRVLLSATDRLRELIQNPGTSNQADIADNHGRSGRAARDHRTPASSPPPREHGRRRICGCFWWKTTSPAGFCCRPSFPATANVTSPLMAGKPWRRFAPPWSEGSHTI